jgi:hypothetical protein
MTYKKNPMHKTLIFILILCCYGLFFNCKKEDVAKNENYIDLQDKMIKIPDGLMIGSTNFDLDIDKDNTIDLSVLVVMSYSSMFPWGYSIQITPKNDYQLSYLNYVDTSWYWNPTLPAKVFQYEKSIIPKIFNVGDTIKIEGNFTVDPTMIVYFQNPGGANSMYHGDIHRNAWVNIGYKYIALRKRKDNDIKLAWIKLKVNSSSVIVLNSCYYIENKEELIIGKQ